MAFFSSIVIEWLRGHSNVHHEISEMEEERNQQQQAVNKQSLYSSNISL